MTDSEWQEQLRIAQDTVNALIAHRDESLSSAANKLANVTAQLGAAQRQLAAKDAIIAEKDKAIVERDARITAMETPQVPKPNGVAHPIEMQAPEAPPA